MTSIDIDLLVISPVERFHSHSLSLSLDRRWNSMRDSQLYCRRGSVQLWQFLLALLEDGLNGAIIVWTGKGLEFKLIEPEEVKDTSLSRDAASSLSSL